MIGQNMYILNIGRLIWGIAFGSFSVVSAKYISEIAPIEYSGTFGAMNQLSLCFGGCLPPLMALAYPLNFGPETDEFYLTTYWRIIWCLPILVSVLQLTLLTCCFRHETPIFLQEQGREEELLVVMKKFYRGMEVRRRLDALQSQSKPKEGHADAQEPTIVETFFDPNIRGSAWVGFWLATFQQWTGINAVIFYSAQLFGSTDGSGLSGTQVTVMINGANFVAALGGSILLGYFGRKTLMVVTQFACIVGMVGMWIFSDTFVDSDTMMYVLIIAFIFAFEFGPGPIAWLYISEVCNDKALSLIHI